MRDFLCRFSARSELQPRLQSAHTQYDEVAIVDASSRESFSLTDQQKMNAPVARMNEEAAGLGANGLLLEGLEIRRPAASVRSHISRCGLRGKFSSRSPAALLICAARISLDSSMGRKPHIVRERDHY